MKKTLLIVLGGGGHTNQMLKLVYLLGDKYNYEYVTAKDDSVSKNKIQYKGRVFRIINPRKMEDRGVIKTFFKFIPSSIQVISLLLKSKSEAVISCGPALSLHISWLSKFIFKKKVIFLESWSRVYNKSLAGRLIYPFADLFFVQWEKEKKNYPNSIYAGRLG